jgi:Cu/Ag efflux protein CusF
MKKTISFMLIALMLSVGFVNTYAAQTHHGQQVASATKMVTGQIARIKNNNLTLKDQSGKYHLVPVSDPSMLQGLKSGDEVTVDYQNGKVTSIKKLEGYTPSASSNKKM